MDNPSDIFSLCRLCLVKDQVNISIFDEQGDIRQIFLKISSCLPIKVSRDDKLPKKICDDCSNKLDLLYEFWNSSANAEKTLLSWLGQAGVKDAGGTINAVAQQIAKPTETLVKLESGVVEGNSVLISPCVNNVDNESFNELPKEESEAAPPPPKRTRRSAAVKAQINIIPESEDDDDIDTTDLPTKLEDGPEDSDAEDKDPSYTEVPGTSANDQPGPSGVGKAGGVEAPILDPQLYLIKSDKNLQVVFAATLPKSRTNNTKTRKNKLCPICGKIITNSSKHEHSQDFSCSKCFCSFKSAESLEEHLQIHLNDHYQCDLCPRVFQTLTDISLHQYSHTKMFKCPKCEATFKSRQSLKCHVAMEESNFKYHCKICGKGFVIRTIYETHLERHENAKKYECKICHKKFNLKIYLQSHERLNHKRELFGVEEVFQCEKCSRTFSFECSLKRHLKLVHKVGEKKRVQCELCYKYLTTTYSLTVHKRLHTGEKNHECTECGEKFSRAQYVHRHMAKKHGIAKKK